MLEQDHIRGMVALATQEKGLAADLQVTSLTEEVQVTESPSRKVQVQVCSQMLLATQTAGWFTKCQNIPMVWK